MDPTPATPRAAPALVTGGFAVLALGALLAVLSLASAELENPAQASAWAIAAGALGAVGTLSAVLGAVLQARG